MVAENISQSMNDECILCNEEISRLTPLFKNMFNNIQVIPGKKN